MQRASRGLTLFEGDSCTRGRQQQGERYAHFMAMLAFGFWSTQVFATDPVITGPAKVLVNGVGEIGVGPDFAILTLGVTHEANTAVKAVKSVSADMTAIMKTLQKESIPERDIQTARVQVQMINNRSQFRATN